MGGTGSSMRAWIFAVVAALALFLGGLVLSYVLWMRIEPGTPPPCAQGEQQHVLAATGRLAGAAALLSPDGAELRITPAHIFHFPFDYACLAPPDAGAAALRTRLGFDWPCAGGWARYTSGDGTFVSLLAVSEADGPSPVVTPVRLRRADFDLAGDVRERLAPGDPLVLRKRPGSDQVLIRTP